MYSYSCDDGSDCKKQVLPAIFSIYSDVSREGKSPTPMAMAVESYGYFLPAENVVRRFRKGSGVTPMARVAVDACATLATGNAPPK